MAILDSLRSLFGGSRATVPALLPPAEAAELPRIDERSPSLGTVFNRKQIANVLRWQFSGDLDPSRYISAVRMAETGDTTQLYSIYETARTRDARLARVCATRNSAVSARDFVIEPADDSAEAKLIAQQCDRLFRSTPGLNTILADLNDAQLTGLSVGQHRWVWDGDLRMSHPEMLPTAAFRWDGYDVVAAPSGVGGYRLADYHPDRFIVHSPSPGFLAVPWRRGALMPLVPISYAKRHGLGWWMSALERFGQPQLVGKVPSGAAVPDSESLREQIEDLLASIGSEWVGAVDQRISIEAIANAKIDSDLHLRFVDWCNKELAIGALGQNLTTEVVQGSHAAARVARLVQIDIALSDIQQLEQVIREQWLRWVVQYNWPGAPLPFFRFALSTPESFTLDEFKSNLCTADEYRTSRGYGPKQADPSLATDEVTAREPLNGAQAQAAQSVVEAVAGRRIPRESGAQLLKAQLLISEEEAFKFLGSAGLTFVPAAPPG